jgi:hypothetical protein
MVGGAAALIEEVGKTKITGEEDRYSHTDLYDFQANVDGSIFAAKSSTLIATMICGRCSPAICAACGMRKGFRRTTSPMRPR